MNYFNYFTEIEEHFQQARATGMFLLSPLDWALVETWKESGIPLEAVHKGIDRAFEKWHARKRKTRLVNSLAYCAQEVLTAARETAAVDGEAPSTSKREPAFSGSELAEYFHRNVAAIQTAAAKAAPALAHTYQETIASLEKLTEAAAEGRLTDLEAVEQRLTVLEERLLGAVRQQLSEEEMLTARQSMERELAPYRGKMSVDQLVLLEKQYLDRRSLESAGLPRLSLFYL